MKKYLAKRSKKTLSKTDIIAINNKAQQDALKGNKIINASIGTYLEDDKTVGYLPVVKEALSKHICDALGYSNSYGDKAYMDGVMKYVFGDKLDKINQIYHPFIGSTMGGTGALSMAFNLFLEEGQVVLLPDIMWTNYMVLAEQAKATYLTYELFNKDDRLNITAIKKAIQQSFKKYRRAVLVINDPCHNPTGYCMDKQEYDELFKMLNEEGKKGQLVVLFDIAYFSFVHTSIDCCSLVDKLVEGNTSFLSLIIFSTSKLLGTYGLRMGALIALLNKRAEHEALGASFMTIARGTYSVPVSAAQVAVAKIFNDQEKVTQLRSETKVLSDRLYKRSLLLIKSLKKYQLNYYPYISGFFVTLKVKDAFKITAQLEKEHMYVVPINKQSIRLALSGLTENEIVTLVKRISELHS